MNLNELTSDRWTNNGARAALPSCKEPELPADGIDERLQNVLYAMRESVGGPLVLLLSLPRPHAEVGGVPNSQHVYGQVADVLCPDGMSVEELAKIAKDCGANGIGRYYDESFVHVDRHGYAARWEG